MVVIDHADGPIHVRRFNATSSVHNVPVERSWAECNDVTDKYRAEWKGLEGRGLLKGGRYADPLDIFCLTTVYLPAIRSDLENHFRAMSLRRKETSTKNPNFPRGTWRPIEGLEVDEDCSLHVDEEQVDVMDDYIVAFHDAEDEEPASAWETDPLPTPALRAQRAEMVALTQPTSLTEEYVAMRRATRVLLGL